jgi:hypothetical protein
MAAEDEGRRPGQGDDARNEPSTQSHSGTTVATSAADPRRLRERVPVDTRSLLANMVLAVVRADPALVDLQEIVMRSLDRVRDRGREARRWGDAAGVKKCMSMWRALADHDDEARDFAAWALANEKLTPEEKAARKQAQADAGVREWMSSRPPSAKQLGFWRNLGGRGEPPATMAGASDAINVLVARAGRGRRA